MMTIREYKRAESLEEAWQLNQKKANRVLGGMIWLKMENINVGTAIDLSGLGLDTIEETEDSFSIGAMVTLRQLEQHPGLENVPVVGTLGIFLQRQDAARTCLEMKMIRGRGKEQMFTSMDFPR